MRKVTLVIVLLFSLCNFCLAQQEQEVAKSIDDFRDPTELLAELQKEAISKTSSFFRTVTTPTKIVMKDGTFMQYKPKDRTWNCCFPYGQGGVRVAIPVKGNEARITIGITNGSEIPMTREYLLFLEKAKNIVKSKPQSEIIDGVRYVYEK